MLVRRLNDGDEALRDISAAVGRIGPDAVHINLPDRPPAELWVEPADAEGVIRALAILGPAARVATPAGAALDLARETDPVEAIVSAASRHPLREAEILRGLAHLGRAEVARVLTLLAADPRAARVERYGERFWVGTGARSPALR
jgi:wyosine [tRNA(Phe)-imidazoG37] synthetase (radical SAM superfamily)